MLEEQVGADGEVVGIDYSSEMIQQPQESAKDISSVRFHTGSVLDIEYPKVHFDASRADRVLQHLEDPGSATEELKRVTKPGGHIGFTDTAWESLLLDAPGRVPPHQFLKQKHQDAVSPEMGRQLYRYVKQASLPKSTTIRSFSTPQASRRFVNSRALIRG